MIGSIRFIREQRFLLHDLTVDQAAVHVHILRLIVVIVVQLIIVEIERIAVFGYANFSVLRFRFLFVERLDQVRIEQRIRRKARQIADERTQENVTSSSGITANAAGQNKNAMNKPARIAVIIRLRNRPIIEKINAFL